MYTCRPRVIGTTQLCCTRADGGCQQQVLGGLLASVSQTASSQAVTDPFRLLELPHELLSTPALPGQTW